MAEHEVFPGFRSVVSFASSIHPLAAPSNSAAGGVTQEESMKRCIFCKKKAIPLDMPEGPDFPIVAFCSPTCAATWACWEVYHRRRTMREDREANRLTGRNP